MSAEQVQAKANELNQEFGRFDPEKRHIFQIEIPNTMFTPYLYDSQGIEIALSYSDLYRQDIFIFCVRQIDRPYVSYWQKTGI